MEKKYWKERKDLNYYKRVLVLCKQYAPQAVSVIDIGSANTEILKELEWIEDKSAIDNWILPDIEEINKIKADFLSFFFNKKYDLALCLQVLEHQEDPRVFFKKILSISDTSIVSLPYMWPKGACEYHKQDPIDEEKVFSWIQKTPIYQEIVTDGNSKRIILVYKN